MNWLVALGGLIVMVMSVLAMLAPQSFVAVISRWTAVRFSVTIGIRLLLGIVFLIGASQTRFPAFISIVGIIIIAVAFVLFFLGRTKVDAMIQWWLRRTSTFMRLWALVGVILGALILYAGLPLR